VGRFVPDRENDKLTRALKNDEHTGRARGTPCSKPWNVAFPVEMKRYPDKSHPRRKEREAAEKAATADRLRNVEEALKRQQDRLDRLSQQGSGQSHRHMVEATFDGSVPYQIRKAASLPHSSRMVMMMHRRRLLLNDTQWMISWRAQLVS
jgi:hypothetical protein